jgi:hypothetical protein
MVVDVDEEVVLAAEIHTPPWASTLLGFATTWSSCWLICLPHPLSTSSHQNLLESLSISCMITSTLDVLHKAQMCQDYVKPLRFAHWKAILQPDATLLHKLPSDPHQRPTPMPLLVWNPRLICFGDDPEQTENLFN